MVPHFPAYSRVSPHLPHFSRIFPIFPAFSRFFPHFTDSRTLQLFPFKSSVSNNMSSTPSKKRARPHFHSFTRFLPQFPAFSRIFPHFLAFSRNFPQFPAFSRIFPQFPAFSRIFPQFPAFPRIFRIFRIFPHFPEFSCISPHFPAFSRIYPNFPAWSRIFPHIPAVPRNYHSFPAFSRFFPHFPDFSRILPIPALSNCSLLNLQFLTTCPQLRARREPSLRKDSAPVPSLPNPWTPKVRASASAQRKQVGLYTLEYALAFFLGICKPAKQDQVNGFLCSRCSFISTAQVQPCYSQTSHYRYTLKRWDLPLFSKST
jgi:hypothetical protein